jgi:tripartite-type tricarboxylate transporter receptor subunit TctC
MPDTPTIAEQGFPGFQKMETASLWAPAGTPAQVIARLQEAVVAALADPDVRGRLETLGMNPVGSTPAELGASTLAHSAAVAELYRAEGIKPE